MGKFKVATMITIILLVLVFTPMYIFSMLNVKEEYKILVGWLMPLVFIFICTSVDLMIIFSPTEEQREKQLVNELEELGYTVIKNEGE